MVVGSPGRPRSLAETYGRDKFPDDLKFASGVELTDYQRETIQFCLERENTPLWKFFWQTRSDACGATWYYCPLAKEARVRQPAES